MADETTGNQQKRVCVVVLGDIGRSPRMQFHALSLAKHGFAVDLVGYAGSKPHNSLLENPSIFLHTMSDVPKFVDSIPRLLAFVFKVLWRSTVLLWSLLWLSKPDYVLVQNPPCIPTLPVTWFYCCLRRSKLVIDWHNYAFTILALSLGSQHLLVRLTKLCEFTFGRRSFSNLCVTKAMQRDLKERCGILAIVLYDRPPAMFRTITDEEKHDLFVKLGTMYVPFQASSTEHEASISETRFTLQENGVIKLKDNRPALIVSSTSYTEDEDFSILLEALEKYEEVAKQRQQLHLPELVVVITGKGPMKEYYTNIVKAKSWTCVEIVMPWLSAEDYPKLLASCDFGVCLHTSSSGFDLPMKVVDMFGCQLPVCAINYSCLKELVKHNENGFVFANSSELSLQMQELLQNFPNRMPILEKFRTNLKVFEDLRWDQCWDQNALPIFRM